MHRDQSGPMLAGRRAAAPRPCLRRSHHTADSLPVTLTPSRTFDHASLLVVGSGIGTGHTLLIITVASSSNCPSRFHELGGHSSGHSCRGKLMLPIGSGRRAESPGPLARASGCLPVCRHCHHAASDWDSLPVTVTMSPSRTLASSQAVSVSGRHVRRRYGPGSTQPGIIKPSESQSLT